jgi:hypothetical protein
MWFRSAIVDLPRSPESSETGQIHNCPQWRVTMARFKLIVHPSPGDETFVPPDPPLPNLPLQRKQGDQLLLIERQLLHPKSGKLVGRFNARLTFMRISGGVVLFSGNADHQLKKGVICTQGSFRSNQTESVFAITGGTDKYRRARGTLTLKSVPSKPEEFSYRVL